MKYKAAEGSSPAFLFLELFLELRPYVWFVHFNVQDAR
jgi:hypothetical protein